MKTFYKADVEDRGKVFSDDEDTNRRLRMISGWLTSGRNKSSLLLYGGVGNGKTTMAQAIASTIDSIRDSAEEVAKKNNYTFKDDSEKTDIIRLRRLPTVRITTAQKIAFYAKNDEEKFDALVDAKFLIIDDLGCEPVAVKNFGTEITPITDVIYRRYELLRNTVITTNLDKNDIRNLYGQRVIDRMEETFDSIAFNTESYRTKK